MPKTIHGPLEGLDLERLLGDAVAVALQQERPEPFLGWMRAHVGDYLGMPAERYGEHGEDAAEEESVLSVLAWQVGRAIWNGLPLPSNQFKPRPLPAPGRNDPCPCGSGAKYKHCCGRLPAMPALDAMALWPLVLERLERGVLKTAVAGRQIPLEGLVLHAEGLRAEGRARKAVELLEPQFADSPPRTDELAEAALDLLCDLYDDLGHWKKKVGLLGRLVEAARRSPLRSGAWQRLATIRMDNGDAEGSWEAFRHALQDAPDAPGVALLEVHLLVSEHRYREASERATFWLRRLRKSRAEGLDGLLAHLEAVAADPAGAMSQAASMALGGTGARLQDWLSRVQGRALPAYELANGEEPLDDSEAIRASLRERLRGMGVSGEQLDLALEQAVGDIEEALAQGAEDVAGNHEEGAHSGEEPASQCLVPPSGIDALDDDWHAVFPLDKPFSVNDTPFADVDPWEPDVEAEWSAWLESHPEAYDSLEILDDIATALSLHPQFGAAWLDDVLLGPVLARAAAIVEAAFAGGSQARLDWGWHLNRPALRSLVRLGWLHRRAGRVEAELAVAEWVVALNPHDNHGLRSELMRGYLQAGRDEAALALAAGFPDDMLVDILYGRPLALFRLGRLEEATQALHDAVRQSPKVARYLLAERCRRPRIDPHGIRLGGDDEAWLYREAMRDTWRATSGAPAWLAAVSRDR